MPAIRFGAGDLLEYNSRYSLLICRECQYAIQKNALESHLLRHKIYRGDRQRLLSSIAQLDLLEPHDVPLPAPGSPPVDALPILSGYRCTAAGCRHLTVSSKRMKRHWSGTHGNSGSVPLSYSFDRPVKLQTFFRGTKVRYFEVTSPAAQLVNTDENDDGDDRDNNNHERCEEDGDNAITATQSPPPRVPAPPGTAHGPSPADFDMETLTYFHHFIAVTFLTLPGAKDPQSTRNYWQMHVVLQALQRRWLICGLLAISAHHLATLADDTMTKWIHSEREAQFSSEFSAGLDQMTGCDLGFEAAKTTEEAEKTGEQLRCLLRCAQWALVEPTVDYDSVVPSQLPSIMSTIRGCVVPHSALRYSGIQKDGHERQEELFAPGFLQIRNSSLDGNLGTNYSSDNTPSLLLNRLHALPFHIAERLERPEDAQDAFATLSAITTMVGCCQISFMCDEVGAAWQGVATWLANVSDHFDQMVLGHHPAALVVLAHWAAILVKRAERVGCWFLKGSAKIIVLQVARQLSANDRAVLDLVESLMDILNN